MGNCDIDRGLMGAINGYREADWRGSREDSGDGWNAGILISVRVREFLEGGLWQTYVGAVIAKETRPRRLMSCLTRMLMDCRDRGSIPGERDWFEEEEEEKLGYLLWTSRFKRRWLKLGVSGSELKDRRKGVWWYESNRMSVGMK